MTKSNAHLSHVENGFFFPQKEEANCQQILSTLVELLAPFFISLVSSPFNIINKVSALPSLYGGGLLPNLCDKNSSSCPGF
jgi:hypothetical protein